MKSLWRVPQAGALVSLFDATIISLATIHASRPGGELALERITGLLDAMQCDYLVEGPEPHDGREGLWIGVHAADCWTSDRWSKFVTNGREAYGDAEATIQQLAGLLALVPIEDLKVEVEAYRGKLHDYPDQEFQQLVAVVEQGGWMHEADWVLIVPELAQRDLIWLRAAVAAVRTMPG